MLLIEWKRPCSVGIGALKLGPGVNEVDSDQWSKLADAGYKRQIEGYISRGDLVLHDGDKPTQAVVAKTYNLELLETWKDDAKGPLLGAIRTRIKELKAEWDKRDKNRKTA